jgi:glycosyltransferase involved in cell wall biosynthesis
MPSASIILPTYNRAKFLPETFEAIRRQTWSDWELIIVDDGSTDGTDELIRELTAGIKQPIRYVWQENQGAYAARNTGLDLAQGKYIAFYDSDDLWLSHHLQDCVRALESNESIDWVYAACSIVDLCDGQEKTPSTFYVGSKPRPFMRLRCKIQADVHIIDDAGAACCHRALAGAHGGCASYRSTRRHSAAHRCCGTRGG